MNTNDIENARSFTISRLLSWAKKSGFAVLDQGLLAAANFLINILLARWLEPEQYGAFAVAYSVFILIGMLYAAIFTEPMMFFGASKYAEHFHKYLGILVYSHWVSTLVIALILSIVAVAFWQFGSEYMAQVLAALAVASPLILHYWLVRGGAYTRLWGKWATVASAGNLVFMLILVFGLMQMSLLSSVSALIAIGIAGLVSSMGLLLILRPQLRFRGGSPTPKMVLRDHWGYGRWIALAQCIYWGSGQILIVLVPVFLGLQGSAILAATMNLFRPVRLLTQSASLLIVPRLSALLSKGINTSSLMGQAKRLVLLFAGGVLAYGMLVFAFSDLAIYHLYGGKYEGYGFLIFLFAMSSTASAVVQVITVILRSTGKVREIIFVWGLSALIVLPLCAPVLIVGGLQGAVLLLACSYIIAGVAAWRRLLNINPEPQTRLAEAHN